MSQGLMLLHPVFQCYLLVSLGKQRFLAGHEAQVLLHQEESMQDAARRSGFGFCDLGDNLCPRGPGDQLATDLDWPGKGFLGGSCNPQPWALGAVLASREG